MTKVRTSLTLKEFKNKNVLLYISKADDVLDYNDTKRTRHALEEAGARLTYIENGRLGHYLSGAKNILGIRRLIKFFEG